MNKKFSFFRLSTQVTKQWLQAHMSKIVENRSHEEEKTFRFFVDIISPEIAKRRVNAMYSPCLCYSELCIRTVNVHKTYIGLRKVFGKFAVVSADRTLRYQQALVDAGESGGIVAQVVV